MARSIYDAANPTAQEAMQSYRRIRRYVRDFKARNALDALFEPIWLMGEQGPQLTEYDEQWHYENSEPVDLVV